MFCVMDDVGEDLVRRYSIQMRCSFMAMFCFLENNATRTIVDMILKMDQVAGW